MDKVRHIHLSIMPSSTKKHPVSDLQGEAQPDSDKEFISLGLGVGVAKQTALAIVDFLAVINLPLDMLFDNDFVLLLHALFVVVVLGMGGSLTPSLARSARFGRALPGLFGARLGLGAVFVVVFVGA